MVIQQAASDCVEGIDCSSNASKSSKCYQALCFKITILVNGEQIAHDHFFIIQ